MSNDFLTDAIRNVRFGEPLEKEPTDQELGDLRLLARKIILLALDLHAYGRPVPLAGGQLLHEDAGGE